MLKPQNSSTAKYKGQLIRAYKTSKEYVQGILIGESKNAYVVLAIENEQVYLKYVPCEDIKLILPTGYLSGKDGLSRLVYSNCN